MSCFNIGCVQSKERQPPHSFQLDHYFGTAHLSTQLPAAENTGSSGKKVKPGSAFPQHIIIKQGIALASQLHPSAHSLLCKLLFYSYSYF